MNNYSELWNELLLEMQNKLVPTSYKTWFENLKLVDISQDNLVVLVESEFNRNVLSNRYTDFIADTYRAVTGDKKNVQFVLDAESMEEAPQKPKREKDYSSELEYTNLNPKYVFEDFVVGNSNRFAHAAAVAVAEDPAKAYNPLFIYGGVGLGKTHLMHAIGHYVLEDDKKKKVLYVSSEMFTNDLINSIKNNKSDDFRRKYRNVDILLIDDIQFIAGKEQTQEEFFHTFNSLHQANKQIIISSDRPPKEIKTLEERLRSRFEWGLITDINAPDYETRIAILKKKAEAEGKIISNEVYEFLAKKIKSNIRELEGALTRVFAYSNLVGKTISIEVCEEALKGLIDSSGPREVNISSIKTLIVNHFGITEKELDSPRRTRNIAYPRQIAMYLSRELTDLSLPKIGELFGGRDHSTVVHAYDKITKDIKNDSQIASVVDALKRELSK